MPGRPVVLVAPLDWGLGHATRCIPIIHQLIMEKAKVILAGDGAMEHLLKKEFPDLIFLPLKGYNIAYSRKKIWFFTKMLLQFPKINRIIKYEKKWLQKTIQKHNIDIVIADNRFGLSNKNVFCVYITHQLFIETGIALLNRIAQKIHYHFINRFSVCWVPDAAGKINLAGKLSHPDVNPKIPVKYIGSLSRFKKEAVEKKIDLLVMLSGPEPQRTIFEKLLLQQLRKSSLAITLIRGLPGERASLENENFISYNHLPAKALNELILQSEMIISRAGYSTIMDLVQTQKKAILVPTPGQKEQEYLATYLMKEKIFYCIKQQDFDLDNSLKALADFDFTSVQNIPVLQKNIILEILADFSILPS